jgi:small-conductance mechanosensitive channel
VFAGVFTVAGGTIIGFASMNTIGNIIAGLIVMVNRPFKVGDRIMFGNKFWRHHNSFIIADSNNAYILETTKKWWIYEKIESIRLLPNQLPIRSIGDGRKK